MTARSGDTTVRRLLTGLAVLTCLIALIVAIQQRHRADERIRHPEAGQINDLDRWMVMVPAMVRDHAPYVNDDLPTPPVSLLVLGPLSALGRANAQFAWALLKLPMIATVFLLARGLVARAGVRLAPLPLALAALAWSLAVVVDLQEGQMNVLMLLPLVAGLYVAQRDTPRSAVAAALFIGLAIAIKVTPVIFVAYFVWRRRWLMAGTTAAAAVAWSLAPAVVFGWNQNLMWLEQWFAIMITPYVTQGRVVYATSQSVGSVALRLLSDMPAFDSHHGGVTASHYMNLAALSQPTVHMLVRTLMLMTGLGGLWWMRTPLAALACRRYVVEAGAVAAFMLWFSERTWIPHYVSFILTLISAAMIASDLAAPAAWRRRAVRSIAVLIVASLFASDAGRLLGPDGVDWVKAAGIYLWPSILIASITVLAAHAGEAATQVDAV